MFGKYAAYVVPAYAVSALVIAGLLVWIRVQYRLRIKEIEALEKSGVSRRAGVAGKAKK